VRGWTRIDDAFLPESLRAQGVDAVRRGRLAVACCVISTVGGLIGGLTVACNGAPGQDIRAGAFAVATLMGVAILGLLRRTGSTKLVGHGIGAGVLAIAAFSGLRSGELGLPALTFLALVPTVVITVAGIREGLAWAVVAALVPLALYAMHRAGVSQCIHRQGRYGGV
jgi:hypothetical protein